MALRAIKMAQLHCPRLSLLAVNATPQQIVILAQPQAHLQIALRLNLRQRHLLSVSLRRVVGFARLGVKQQKLVPRLVA